MVMVRNSARRPAQNKILVFRSQLKPREIPFRGLPNNIESHVPLPGLEWRGKNFRRGDGKLLERDLSLDMQAFLGIAFQLDRRVD